VAIYWPNQSYIFLFPLFLHVPIALTVINPFSAFFIDLCVGWINPGTFGAALTTQCYALSEALMRLAGSRSGSSSAVQSSTRWFGLSKPLFQLSKFLESEMVWGALFWTLSSGWWLILLIQCTFDTWVHPPGWSFVDRAGQNGDLSDNLNAAAPSCWKFDQEALMIPSVSEMYPLAVICVFWARDSFCVAHRFWLLCHIPKKSCTLAILCDILFSASFFNSKLCSVSVVSNPAQPPANIPLLAQTNCPTTTFPRSVLWVVLDCLQPITSRRREILALTPTPCGIMETMSRATLVRSAYFECGSSCWCHQSVLYGYQNVLLISMGSEWLSLRFGYTCPQVFGASGSEFK